MTRSHAGFCSRRLELRGRWPSFPPGARQWFPYSFTVLILAMFLSPVINIPTAGIANAQSVRHTTRRAGDTRLRRVKVYRRGQVKRTRYKKVSRPQKTLFGALFGSKPARKKKVKPFNGLKSFFDSFQAPRPKPRASSLRVEMEKRMREAGRSEALATSGWNRNSVWSGTGGRQSSNSWGRGRVRTMCVRLCDGYYFPVSFKTSTRKLESDENYCNSNCYNAPTKLFYYSNPGGSIENMRSADGTLYRDIANAFRYRKEYVADCRCQAEPWSKQARQQHESWKLEEEISREAVQNAQNRQTGEFDLSSATRVGLDATGSQY